MFFLSGPIHISNFQTHYVNYCKQEFDKQFLQKAYILVYVVGSGSESDSFKVVMSLKGGVQGGVSHMGGKKIKLHTYKNRPAKFQTHPG